MAQVFIAQGTLKAGDRVYIDGRRFKPSQTTVVKVTKTIVYVETLSGTTAFRWSKANACYSDAKGIYDLITDEAAQHRLATAAREDALTATQQKIKAVGEQLVTEYRWLTVTDIAALTAELTRLSGELAELDPSKAR